jgi:hypothetical protein
MTNDIHNLWKKINSLVTVQELDISQTIKNKTQIKFNCNGHIFNLCHINTNKDININMTIKKEPILGHFGKLEIKLNKENFIIDTDIINFCSKQTNNLSEEETKILHETIISNSLEIFFPLDQKSIDMSGKITLGLIVGSAVLALIVLAIYKNKKQKTNQPITQPNTIKNNFNLSNKNLILFASPDLDASPDLKNHPMTKDFCQNLILCERFGYTDQDSFDQVIRAHHSNQQSNEQELGYMLVAIKDEKKILNNLKNKNGLEYEDREKLKILIDQNVIYQCIRVDGSTIEKLQMRGRG